jgi:RHS repeat-associated protein
MTAARNPPWQASARRLFGVGAILIVLASLALGGSGRPANAQQNFGDHVLGWYTPFFGGGGAYFGDPVSACQAQHDSFAPNTIFLGIKDTYRWDSKDCDWSWVSATPLPGVVGFNCDSGYTPQPNQTCVDQRHAQRNDDINNCGGNNGGGTPTPGSDNPINFLYGTKEFSVQDFVTADGSLDLTRRYNSLSFGASYIFASEPLGLGKNWRFSFQHELQLDSWYGTFWGDVELETAHGLARSFVPDSSGNFTVNVSRQNGGGQTDHTIEFVGTWPGKVNSVLAAPTQWRMRDPQNRVWLFQTFPNPDSGLYDLGRPVSVTFLGGLQWTFQYGSHNELASITDSFGKQLIFTWILADPSTLGSGISGPVRPQGISKIALPDGTTLQYTYSPPNPTATALPQAGRLAGVAHLDASGNVIDATTYLYEDPVNIYGVTGILDKDGTRRWTVAYNTAGQAVSSAGPGDVDQTTVAYSASPSNSTTWIRTVTNALGKTTTYTFPEFNFWMDNRLTEVDGAPSTNCPASARSYTYGSDSFVASTTDEEGRVTTYTHDPRGMPTSIIRGSGTPQASTTTYTWHPTLRVPTQIVQPGLTTNLTWNAQGQLTQRTQTDTTTQTVPYATNGQTRTWTYTYEPIAGYLASVDGPLPGTGDTVTYAYNSQGYLQTVTNEVGLVTQATAWNGRGQPTSMTDPNGAVTNYTYDGLGRLTGIAQDPTGINATWGFSYDAVGEITQVKRPNGAFLQYTWDTAKRLTTVTDNTGATINYGRDLMGNATSTTIKDAGGNIQFAQTATFDELSRLLTSVGAASQTWKNAYDKTDNQVSVTDPRSNIYRWGFDALNRLISETNEDNSPVNLTRNGKDEITAYQDPRTLTTTYVRDGFGDVIQRVSPDTGTTVYQYDARGDVTAITDGRGVVTNLTYDNAGRLLTKQYPAAPGENITYTWDSTASGNKGAGRITTITDASGSIQWTYDTLGRTVQETKTTAGVTYMIGYAYDAAGNITQITYPSGRTVNYARDALGRISGVTTQASATATPVTLASNIAYEPFGALQSLTYGNGLALSKTFTPDYLESGMSVSGSAGTVMSRTLGRTDNINITGITDNLDSTRSETFSYTPSNRLQSASGAYGALTWQYDGVGSRTQEVLTYGPTTTSVYTYPSTSNQLGSITQGGVPTRSFATDGAGNIIADTRSGTAYLYDYNNRGRLDQVTVAGTVLASYGYDALERMAIRTTQNMTPSGTTYYLYDLSGQLLAEASAGGTTVTEYVWLDDLPLAVFANLDTASPNLCYVHADHLNRPIKMTDGSSAVVWDALYFPFGATFAIYGSATNNTRFPGQYFLLEAGLHYNWHRHYDPTLGRYIQPDPLSMLLSEVRSAAAAIVGLSMLNSPGGQLADVAVALAAAGQTTLKSDFAPKGSSSSLSLAEFADGPSLYAYANSTPIMKVDPMGLQVGSVPSVPQTGGSCPEPPRLCLRQYIADLAYCIRRGFGHDSSTVRTADCIKLSGLNYRACKLGWFRRPYEDPYPPG